jgi:hypothetical protein
MAMVIVTFWQARGRSHVGCEAGGWHSLSDDVEINPTSSAFQLLLYSIPTYSKQLFLAIREKDDYGKF